MWDEQEGLLCVDACMQVAHSSVNLMQLQSVPSGMNLNASQGSFCWTNDGKNIPPQISNKSNQSESSGPILGNSPQISQEFYALLRRLLTHFYLRENPSANIWVYSPETWHSCEKLRRKKGLQFIARLRSKKKWTVLRDFVQTCKCLKFKSQGLKSLRAFREGLSGLQSSLF